MFFSKLQSKTAYFFVKLSIDNCWRITYNNRRFYDQIHTGGVQHGAQKQKNDFLGDSITEGVGVADKKNLYWKRFEQDGCEVHGYGIGGTRTAYGKTASTTN